MDILGLIVSVIAAGLLAVGLVIAFNVRRGAAWEAMTTRLTQLETRFEVLWNAFAKDLVNILHHPDLSKRIPDKLLDEYYADTITTEGLNQLSDLMSDVAKDMTISEGERQAAKALITLLADHSKWFPH